jgi:hypothetical protein
MPVIKWVFVTFSKSGLKGKTKILKAHLLGEDGLD